MSCKVGDTTADEASGDLCPVAPSDNQRHFGLQLALFAIMLFLYGGLLVWQPSVWKQDLTFNSMLDHLVHGRFDVDPQIVGYEGFLRNGRVYAYWGIWCALLRLPLWIFRRMDLNVTAWSCLAAVCLAGMAKVRTVLLLRRHGTQDRAAKQAFNLMLVYIVLGGAAIGYLRASIFQEVMFWAVAFAAVFNYLAIKGLIARSFDVRTLCWMALCAGLALLTRVSTGIGLALAFGFLLLMLTARPDATAAGERRFSLGQTARAFTRRRFLLPIGILSTFIAATGAVNYFRWGNALTFANYSLYLFYAKYPDRIPPMARYGLFNLIRVPFGLVYYFFPIWAVRTRGGDLLWEHTLTRLFDVVELPPSSFLLTDLLPLCFIVFLAVALYRRRTGGLPPARQWSAIAAGLLAPCILMLTLIWMGYRYRMEFYPEIDFLAYLGLYVVLTDETMRAKFARRRVWMQGATILSVAASFAALVLYWLAPFGSAHELLHRGFVHGHFLIL